MWFRQHQTTRLKPGAKALTIQALNTAIAEALPAMAEVASKNLHADLLVRAVAFSTGAWWHAPDAMPVSEFAWQDLTAPPGGVTDLGEAHPSIGEVRNIGLFGILELVKDRKTKEPMAPWNASSPEMAALKKYCLDHGLFLYTHWHTVLIIPPLIITEEQLRDGFDVLDQALEITDKSTKP